MYKNSSIWLIILSMAIILLYDNDFVSSNKYISSSTITYQVINVNHGDSLWTISAKYVTEKDDIRHLIATIKSINQLDNNTQIYPGQLLKIPVASDDAITLAKKNN